MAQHTHNITYLYLYGCTLANTYKWVFSFWDVCFLSQFLTFCPQLDMIPFFFFFSKSTFLRCQAALRARWTVCVICVTVSMAPWQKRTCSADAVRGGQGYFEHCSASSTSTLPSSTCTSPGSALLWVICVSVGVSACLLQRKSLLQRHPGHLIQKLGEFFCVFLSSCVSVGTTCSTSVSSSSRSAAVKTTTSSSRTTLS